MICRFSLGSDRPTFCGQVCPAVRRGTPFAKPGIDDASRSETVDHLGQPIAGATVKLDNETTVVTDADGAFVFTKAAAGDHVVSASAEGHVAAMLDVTVAAMAREEITITLAREGTGDDPPADDPGDEMSSGCSTSAGGGPLLLLALLALRRRRA